MANATNAPTLHPALYDEVGPFGNKVGMPQLSWRYQVDFAISGELNAWYTNAVQIYPKGAKCPLEALKGELAKSHMAKGWGRWQSVEFDEVVQSELDEWEFGNTKISNALYRKPDRTLNLRAIETTGGFVKRFALMLRDCAIDRNSGFYYPYVCRYPLDIYLTTSGFKSNYTKTYVYHQCGIIQDDVHDMGYDKEDVVGNTLQFLYRRMELRDVNDNDYSSP